MVYAVQAKAGEELNRIYAEDLSIHEWYRFVLSYPPHLICRYIDTFGLTKRHWVLDPFCGTGTTLVECKKNGIPSTGLEANPVVQFAAQTKVLWDIDPDDLVRHAKNVARSYLINSLAVLSERYSLSEVSLMDRTDDQWSIVSPLRPACPKRRDGRGRPWRCNRAVLNGIL